MRARELRSCLLVGALLVAGAAAAAPDGEALYGRCLACHALRYDRVGPHHCGLAGRVAGSVPGFAYSAAMRDAGIVWQADTLDRFLAAPAAMVPGTTMTYAGIADPAERAALIDWLLAPAQAACR